MKNKRMTAMGLAFLGLLGALLSFGCRAETEDTLVLRVANWEEYLDEGGWEDDERIILAGGDEVYGENSIIADFEDWYEQTYGRSVRVAYATFGTNEDLYNQLTMGDTFDVVCPSEYMIMKLLDEGMLTPFSADFFDDSREENYYVRGVSPYIRQRLAEQEIGGERLSAYAAGYMWGTLGFVYNPKEITRQEASDWNLLRNPAYRKRITAKDSVRDCYFAALGMMRQEEVSAASFRSRADYAAELSRLLNDTSPETVAEAEELLATVKDNVYSFETDSGKADLVTGKVAANLQWSGDAVYSMEQAAEDGVTLCYAVPDACTNMWFDGWCLLQDGVGEDAKRRHAAEAFVNFLSRPDNAIRNMYYIGYTSAISGGDDDRIFQYVDWRYGSGGADGVDGADGAGGQTAGYDLGYFFSGQEDDVRYRMEMAGETQQGTLYAAYPPKDVLDRSVVMAYFPAEVNRRISRMWINIRCFSFSKGGFLRRGDVG